LFNSGKLASGPAKELLRPTRPDVFRGWRGWHSPDVWDANFKEWAIGALANDPHVSRWVSGPGTDYLVGVVIDDTDRMAGFGAGANFKTATRGNRDTATGRQQPHFGWFVLVTPPEQAGREETPNGMVYKDTVVYAKRALADFLQARYPDIDVLNSAWNATYSTFGSTAVSYSQQLSSGSDGAAVTFAATLNKLPVTPFTVSIKVNGAAAAGDSGTGKLHGNASATTSTIDSLLCGPCQPAAARLHPLLGLVSLG
jgi:hypothetical protein